MKDIHYMSSLLKPVTYTFKFDTYSCTIFEYASANERYGRGE